ncbi:MAG TPA: YceI family protein [Caulobacterales bacterium]|nr:YceI family protein [Caulobacterales bacterium]
MRAAGAALAVLALAACSQPAQQKAAEAPALPPPMATDAPAGQYELDPEHASLIFRVDHLGFSNFTGRFARWNVTLDLDPAHPENASVSATIDPASFEVDRPAPGFLDEIKGPSFLNAAGFPQMTFRSTRVERTGADTARVTGDFSFRGQTHPVTLEVKFNGGYPGMSLDPHARVGFAVRGALKRSDFGFSSGLPPPGTKFGVGDEVTFEINCELTGPDWTPPQPSNG